MIGEKSARANNGSSGAGNASRGGRHVPARKKATGNWNPDWESFAKLDPAWTEKAIALAIAPAVAGALDAKTIELIGIALDTSCTHMYAPGVRRHIQRALKVGATREEITAVLQLVSLQGLHSMCLGAPILLEELKANERGKA
jgi:alkylhydroperoxidase/carboxymuconolactone decarboxylase family protein YurZ